MIDFSKSVDGQANSNNELFVTLSYCMALEVKEYSATDII